MKDNNYQLIGSTMMAGAYILAILFVVSLIIKILL